MASWVKLVHGHVDIECGTSMRLPTRKCPPCGCEDGYFDEHYLSIGFMEFTCLNYNQDSLAEVKWRHEKVESGVWRYGLGLKYIGDD